MPRHTSLLSLSLSLYPHSLSTSPSCSLSLSLTCPPPHPPLLLSPHPSLSLSLRLFQRIRLTKETVPSRYFVALRFQEQQRLQSATGTEALWL